MTDQQLTALQEHERMAMLGDRESASIVVDAVRKYRALVRAMLSVETPRHFDFATDVSAIEATEWPPFMDYQPFTASAPFAPEPASEPAKTFAVAPHPAAARG